MNCDKAIQKSGGSNGGGESRVQESKAIDQKSQPSSYKDFIPFVRQLEERLLYVLYQSKAADLPQDLIDTETYIQSILCEPFFKTVEHALSMAEMYKGVTAQVISRTTSLTTSQHLGGELVKTALCLLRVSESHTPNSPQSVKAVCHGLKKLFNALYLYPISEHSVNHARKSLFSISQMFNDARVNPFAYLEFQPQLLNYPPRHPLMKPSAPAPQPLSHSIQLLLKAIDIEAKSRSPDQSAVTCKPRGVAALYEVGQIHWPHDIRGNGLVFQQLMIARRYNHLRRWLDLRPVGENVTIENSMPISVMSYNVLSQKLLEDHQYLYRNCAKSILVWRTRSHAIVNHIALWMPDIVCLQEMDEDFWFSHFYPFFNLHGYNGVFKKRTGDKTDGCAIIFNQSKFSLLKYVPVEFFRGGILDRDNVGIVVVLQPNRPYYNGDAEKICVATTHLLFNPRRGDVKLAQLMVFLAELDKCASYNKTSKEQPHSTQMHANEKQPGSSHGQSSNAGTNSPIYCPTILCGDFNMEPFSQLYEFIRKGHIHYSQCLPHIVSNQTEGLLSNSPISCFPIHLLPLQLQITERCRFAGKPRESPNAFNTGHAYHSFNFKSAYDHGYNPSTKMTGEISSYHANTCCTLDYIFYSSEQIPVDSPIPQATKRSKSEESLSRDRKNRSKKHPQKKSKGCHSATRKDDSRQSDRSSDSDVPLVIDIEENSSGGDGEQASRLAMSDTGNNHPEVTEDDSHSSSSSSSSSRGAEAKPMQQYQDRLQLIYRYTLINSSDIRSVDPMPNADNPSDHLFLLTQFILH